MANGIDGPLRETRAPRLEQFDWQHLQRLTESLLAHEPDVLTASEYGKPGQAQFGIDTKAELKGRGCDVASCKNVEGVAKGQLAKWSKDFLDHWDVRWQNKQVRRFILVTTADISPTQVNDAADVERARFASISLDYELWGQPQLIEKMRPHPGIVAQFVGSDWVESICGQRQRQALQPDGASVGVEGVGASEIAELRAVLSGEAEQRVARGLDDLRAGQVDAVDRAIADLRTEALWTQLTSRAKARVLRFATSAALHRKDLDAAVALAGEADALEPAEEPRIAARIAFARDGARAGLEVLGTPTTRDGRQLQVAFHLTAGDIDGAEAVLELLTEDGHDPETTRLQAWVALMRNRRDDALKLVAQLEKEAGHWLATVRTAALARYAAALSPALKPEWFLNASPVDLDLVREDANGQALLSGSIEGLKDLVRRSDDIDDRRWLLAALANHRERRDEAEALARSLIAQDPADPATIAWVLARRFDADLGASLDLLTRKYARGEADQIDVRVFALMLVSRQDTEAARTTLAAHGADQANGDAREEAEKWTARLTPDGDPVATGVPEAEVLVDAIRFARTTDDWEVVRSGFAALAGGKEPEPQTLAVALMIGGEGRWDILSPHREAILSFATAEAVRVVAYLIAATETDEALRTFLESHRGAFRDGEVPPDVRRLMVDRQRRSGDLVGALAEAQALSRHSGVSADRHLEAELRASIGDTRGAAHIVRDLLRTAELDSRAALGWGEALRASDMGLARDLWRYAVARDDERRHAVFAFMQAFSLGLEKEAAPLYPEVERAASEGSSAVRAFDLAELPEFIRTQNANAQQRGTLYLEGRMPVHLLVEHENVGLDALVMGDSNRTKGPLRLRLLRSGARPRHIQLGIAWPDWRLHMDLGALLVAAEFELLDLVEQHPHAVTISSAVPSALLEMERKASPTQPARLDLLRGLTALVDQSLVGGVLSARAKRSGDLIVGLVDPDNPTPCDHDLFQLVDAVFAAGVIDETECLAAKAAWLREGEPAADSPVLEAPLPLGSSLWLEGAAAEQLHRAQILTALCRAYDVAIDPDILAVTRAYVATESAKAERALWLAALRERLRRAIEAGKFVFVRRNAAREAAVADMGSQDAATANLIDMLIAEGTEGGVTWFEDRNVTGYPANNSHPIVEFVDVLEALGAVKILSPADLRGRLSRFLGAGGGFVQLEADDVVPALRAAPIVDGVVRETPALVAIRRNRAATRLLDEHLKIGPSDDPEDHRPDEVQLLTSEMRLADACLTAIWSDTGQAIAECVARSEWVWQTLRLERVLRSVPEDQSEGAARMLATLCFASASEALATPTDLPAGRRIERRRAYADWFWNSVLGPHAVGDPDIVERVAQYIVNLYLPRLDGRLPTATNRQLERQLIRLRLAALPQRVLNALGLHERFAGLLGIRPGEIVSIGRGRFDAARFWRAARTARRYGRAKLRTLSGKRCMVVPTVDGLVITGAIRTRLVDDFCLTFDRGVDQQTSFGKLLAKLELTPAEHAAIVERARAATAPHRLSKVWADARKKSAKAAYAELDRSFQRDQSISGAIFVPPPALALLHYLRLEPGDEDFGSRLDRAGAQLREELGEREALRRLRGLPVPDLAERIGIAASGEIVADLAGAPSPVGTVHWARMALGQPSSLEEGATVSNRAFERIAHGAEPLAALLQWTAQAFWRDSAFRELGASDRLALIWLHANRVIETFLWRGADPALTSRFFEKGEFPETWSDVLDPRRCVEGDIASPNSLTADALVFHMMGALVGDRAPDELLGGELARRLRARFRIEGANGSAPNPALTLRNFGGPNRLGSFLDAAPAPLTALAGEPQHFREAMLSQALGTLTTDPTDVLSWAILAEHAKTGLGDEQLSDARTMLGALDLGWIAALAPGELRLMRLVVKAMGLILPTGDRAKILDVIGAAVRNAMASEVTSDLPEGGLDPTHELVELCAVYAGIESVEIFDRFERSMIVIAEVWPASVPALRDVVSRIARTNGFLNARPLWRLHIYLNACP